MGGFGLLAAAAALAWPLASACGQPLDFVHGFARQAGGSGTDIGRGVGVWYDGTVMSAAELDQGTTPQTRIAFDRAGASLGMTIAADPGGYIRPADLAGANLDADSTLLLFGHPTAYVAGTFAGSAALPSVSPIIGDGATNGYIAKVYADFSTPLISSSWARAITAPNPGKVEVLSISPGPPCPTGGLTDLPEDRVGRPICPGNGTGSGVGTFVAAAGYFTGTATFPATPVPVPQTATGGEDGFVSLHAWDTGLLALNTSILLLGSAPGNERVTAVAVDPKDEHIVVAGWFTNTAIDFNPNGDPFGPATFAGGKDIFVAKYVPTPTGELLLVWLYTTGTPGDDEPSDVAVDSRGHVYATGWLSGYCAYPDTWAVRIPQPPPQQAPYYAVPEWVRTWAGEGDEKGLGVAVDHLDRALFTGYFARVTCQMFRGGGNAPLAPLYCLDLNPNPGPTQVDNRCVVGGRDIFVLRMRPDAAYDGAYTFGGAFDDEGRAVAVDPFNTARLAHTGSFGGTVDFDPGPGTANLISSGGTDAFVNALDPAIPTGIKHEVSLVLDNSGSIDEADYVSIVKSLFNKIQDAVPANGTVLMNVVWFGLPSHDATRVARVFVPWTPMTATNTPLFARRLLHQALVYGESDNWIDDGIRVAADAVANNGVSGTYRHLLVIAGGRQSGIGGNLPAARDEVMGGSPPNPATAKVDQISGLAVKDDVPPMAVVTRAYFLSAGTGMVESIVQVPANPDPEDNLGIAAETPNDHTFPENERGFFDPQFLPLLERMLQRITVCQADYERDGDVDPMDSALFQLGLAGSDPYADWNFDNLFSDLDWDRFERAFLVVPCP